MFDEEGRPKQITKLENAEAFKAFERVEQRDTNGKTNRAGSRVRFIDRVEILALLGKALGYYADQRDVKGLGSDSTAPSVTINVVPVSITPQEAYRQISSGPKT